MHLITLLLNHRQELLKSYPQDLFFVVWWNAFFLSESTTTKSFPKARRSGEMETEGLTYPLPPELYSIAKVPKESGGFPSLRICETASATPTSLLFLEDVAPKGY